jgi:AmmeMemoRadiSam system protein B
MFLLRDPLHYSESQLHVSPDVFVIASLFDGEHDFQAIKREFRTRFGANVTDENIQRVKEAMDEAHLLDGPSFEDWRRGIENAYHDLPVRTPILAGNCYPEDDRDVAAYLDKYFVADGGPGRPAERKPDAKPLRGLVVPHIDLRRGGPSFAHAYKVLWEAKPPETVVILGVAHASKGDLFSFTKKPYGTPLGTLAVDEELVGRLAGHVDNPYADEFAHKGEHSIEIQAIWLQHITGSNAPKIVPILTGSLRECIEDDRPPREVRGLVGFAKELGAVLKESQGRVLALASVDLAHIGQKFGDEVPLTPRLLRKNRELDQKMLEIIADGDPDEFFDFVQHEEDRRKICGLTPIYILLSALKYAGGKTATGILLHYDQSPEEETQSLVSYAALSYP